MPYLPALLTILLLLSNASGISQCLSGFFGPEDLTLVHHGLEKVNGGGFVSFGIKTEGPHGSDDWFLNYYDSEYSLQWSKAIGTSHREQGTNLVCREVPGLGFVLAGYYKVAVGTPREWLSALVNYEGNILWVNTLPSVGYGIGDTPRDCLVIDERIVFVGTTNSYGSGDSDAIIICLNFEGELLWSKVMGGPENDHFYGIILNHEGHFVIAGNNQSHDFQHHHNWILKMDLEGNVLNEFIYEASLTDTAFDIYQAADLSYWITGETVSFGDLSKNIQILRLNTDFDFLAQYVILQEGIDGGVSIAGEGSTALILGAHNHQNIQSITLLSLDDLPQLEAPTIKPNPGSTFFTSNFAPQSLIIDNGIAVIAGNTTEIGGTYAQLCYIDFATCIEEPSSCIENNTIVINEAAYFRSNYTSFKEDLAVIGIIEMDIVDLNLNNITDCVNNPCELTVYTGDNEISVCLGDTISLSAEVYNSGPYFLNWQVAGDSISSNISCTILADSIGTTEVNLIISTDIEGCFYFETFLINVTELSFCELDSVFDICDGSEVLIEFPFCNTDSTQIFLAQHPGNYSFVYSNDVCSVSIFNLEIITSQDFPFLDLDGQSICTEDPFIIPVEKGDIHVVNDTIYQESYSLPAGSYTLSILGDNCEHSIEFQIFNPDISFFIPDTLTCSLPITIPLECENCNWEIPGVALDSYATIKNPGIYNYIAWNDCDTTIGSFIVQLIDQPQPILEIACPGDSIIFNTQSPSQTFIDNGLSQIEVITEISGRFFYHILDSASGCILNQALDVVFFNEQNFKDTFICSENIFYLDSIFMNFGEEYSVYSSSHNEVSIYYFEHSICPAYNDTISVLNLSCSECDNSAIYVPNSITYNFDGLNDFLQPTILCPFESIVFKVFNRWGELIFETTNVEDKWPKESINQEIPLDLYVWVLSIKFPNEKDNRVIRGHVALLK